jgi:cytochrome c2
VLGKLLIVTAILVPVAVIGQDKPKVEHQADVEKGNEVFDEQCSMCHHADSLDRKTGPGLKLLFAKEKLESNGKPVNDANVIERIVKGAKGMPAFDNLSKEDVTDLIAYLKTI